jgi:hypothetical protein
MKNTTLYFIMLAALVTSSCETSFDEPKSSAGAVDLTRYVAIGNSLTAGYADNALYLEGQQNAYPAILAQQFKKAGGAAVFNTPIFNRR